MDELYQDDQDFMEILERNERAELCTYRMYVLDEIRSRKDGTKRQLVRRQDEPIIKLWDIMQAIIFFTLTALSILIIIISIRTELVLLATLFSALAVGDIIIGTMYIVDLKRTMLSSHQAAYDAIGEENTRRSTISTDPDKILNAKKAKLDEILGFATGPQ